MVKRWKIVSVSVRARLRDRKDKKRERESVEPRWYWEHKGVNESKAVRATAKRNMRKKKLKEKNPYDRNENSVMDSDIKTSHLFLPMKKAFYNTWYLRRDVWFIDHSKWYGIEWVWALNWILSRCEKKNRTKTKRAHLYRRQETLTLAHIVT